MPSTEAFRQHKKRQRQRNQERRQIALDELLGRIAPLSSSPLPPPTGRGNKGSSNSAQCSVTDLYEPIPRLSTPQDFWGKVPDACNPNAALMDSSIVADEGKFANDKYHLDKLQRKLHYKKQRGEITEEEEGKLWKQHGRTQQIQPKSQTHEDLPPPPQSSKFKSLPAQQPSKECQAPITLLSASRGQRKAWQVENFVALLQDKLLPGMTVIDFGSGSGNLCLALAAYFPKVRFVLVDKKPYPLQLVERRAASSNLANVQIQQFTFSPKNLQSYKPPPFPSELNAAKNISLQDENSFHLGIGLHCCGSFTDMVMELCRNHSADCIVCPCCNGGMKAQATGGYNYPRSTFLQYCMSEEEYLQQLSKSADDLQNYAAKCWIEYDRAVWAHENGFSVELWKMMPLECTPKHHVLYLRH